MPLNVPAAGNGFLAVTTSPGATVYFYATTNWGVVGVMASANSWTVLNGTAASDGSGVVADSDGIAAIQAPWIVNGGAALAVAFGGVGQCGMAVCLSNYTGVALALNKRGVRSALGRFGPLNPTIRLAGGGQAADMWPRPRGFSYHGGAAGGPNKHHAGNAGKRARFLHTVPKAPDIVQWG